MAYEILVLNVAAAGHVHASLPAIAELARRGHRVHYVTSAEFAPTIAAAGAEPVLYTSPMASVNPAEVLEAADDGATGHLFYLKENDAIRQAAEARFADAPPDMVVFDSFPFIAGRLLATRWRRPSARLHAGFASNERFSYSRAVVAEAGFAEPLTFGRFAAALRSLLDDFGVTQDLDEFWDAIDDFNVVFIPREFQVEGPSFDDRFVFAGPGEDDGGLLGDWTPPRPGPPVVLVSLGATFGDRPDFFRNCATAFGAMPWHTVLSLGPWVDAAALGPLPPSVEAHNWVSHQAVLAHSAACVTHGGVGTVMQALGHGLPLVVAPQSPDAMPVARRVAELGLGVLLPFGEDDGERLRDAVSATLADEPMRRRAAEMGRCVRGAGGAAAAADALEARLGERIG
ncbi:macrolide family glycosyltransferase [Amycolatopsis sp. NPDC005003]